MEKKKNATNVLPPSENFQQIVAAIVQDSGGRGPHYICSKNVNRSDVDTNQHRLQLPAGILSKLEAVLDAEEMKKVNADQGLPVTLVDGDRRVVQNMKFKFYNTNRSFRIIGNNYTRFVRNYGLRGDAHAIHVWVFHVGVDVWIALIKQDLVQPIPTDVPMIERILRAGWKVKNRRSIVECVGVVSRSN